MFVCKGQDVVLSHGQARRGHTQKAEFGLHMHYGALAITLEIQYGSSGLWCQF